MIVEHIGVRSSDAWVLLASIYAGQGKPASLEAVIAAADYINHAVLAFEEMEGALARLTEGGYITYSAGRLIPTQKTLTYYQTIKGAKRSIYDELNDMRGFIGISGQKPVASPQTANAGAAFSGLSRELFNDAVASYVSYPSGVPKE